MGENGVGNKSTEYEDELALFRLSAAVNVMLDEAYLSSTSDLNRSITDNEVRQLVRQRSMYANSEGGLQWRVDYSHQDWAQAGDNGCRWTADGEEFKLDDAWSRETASDVLLSRPVKPRNSLSRWVLVKLRRST